jgi:Mn-dependent DtxR family transcriptional regulator
MPNNEGKILFTLVHLHDIVKIEEPDKDRVMKTSQVKSTTFPGLVSRMAKKGLVEYGSSPGTLKITTKGRDVAPEGGFTMPTSNEEYQRQILEKLKGKPKLIFEILMDGKPHASQSIMDAIDCKNPKTFAPMVSRTLKKDGYIEYVGRGTMKLSSECYPMGM